MRTALISEAPLASVVTVVKVHAVPTRLLPLVGGELDGWDSYQPALAAVTATAEPSDGCEMLYSSGTSGRPKGIRRPLPTENGSWAQGVLEQAARAA